MFDSDYIIDLVYVCQLKSVNSSLKMKRQDKEEKAVKGKRWKTQTTKKDVEKGKKREKTEDGNGKGEKGQEKKMIRKRNHKKVIYGVCTSVDRTK